MLLEYRGLRVLTLARSEQTASDISDLTLAEPPVLVSDVLPLPWRARFRHFFVSFSRFGMRQVNSERGMSAHFKRQLADYVEYHRDAAKLRDSCISGSYSCFWPRSCR